MVQDLEDRLVSLEQFDLQQQGNNPSSEKKEIRVWMDGVFDMMHYGHVNAFRQGRSLGTHLIVGVNSDETITKCKGKPICSEQVLSIAIYTLLLQLLPATIETSSFIFLTIR